MKGGTDNKDKKCIESILCKMLIIYEAIYVAIVVIIKIRNLGAHSETRQYAVTILSVVSLMLIATYKSLCAKNENKDNGVLLLMSVYSMLFLVFESL